MKRIQKLSAILLISFCFFNNQAFSGNPGHDELRNELIKQFEEPGLSDHQIKDISVKIFFMINRDKSITTTKIDTENEYLKNFVQSKMSEIRLAEKSKNLDAGQYQINVRFRVL